LRDSHSGRSRSRRALTTTKRRRGITVSGGDGGVTIVGGEFADAIDRDARDYINASTAARATSLADPESTWCAIASDSIAADCEILLDP